MGEYNADRKFSTGYQPYYAFSPLALPLHSSSLLACICVSDLTYASCIRGILFLFSILSPPCQERQKPFTTIMIFGEWILGIIKTLLYNMLQNPLSLTWNHQLLGFSTSLVMCVSYSSTCLAANYFQCSDLKKEINMFGVLL